MRRKFRVVRFGAGRLVAVGDRVVLKPVLVAHGAHALYRALRHGPGQMTPSPSKAPAQAERRAEQTTHRCVAPGVGFIGKVSRDYAEARAHSG